MGRKVGSKIRTRWIEMPYRSALLNNGGMVHQVRRDVVVYDRWGQTLAVFHTSGSPATAWQSAKWWLTRHPEAGTVVGERYETTQAAIVEWVTERKALFEELDENQRKAAEVSLQTGGAE
jgi:hypothetical protein